jgi:hypothetical protein
LRVLKNQVKEGEIGRKCSTGGGEENIHDFGVETGSKEA